MSGAEKGLMGGIEKGRGRGEMGVVEKERWTVQKEGGRLWENMARLGMGWGRGCMHGQMDGFGRTVAGGSVGAGWRGYPG